jgi:hypothetical protein
MIVWLHMKRKSASDVFEMHGFTDSDCQPACRGGPVIPPRLTLLFVPESGGWGWRTEMNESNKMCLSPFWEPIRDGIAGRLRG